MGTIHLARDTRLQRDVAIKVLNNAAVVDAVSVERFKREVKAIASLSHPNVIGLYDFTDEDGTDLAVMEYAQGTTLDLGDETMSSPELKTQIGTIMGTVGYMSPEQVRGNAADKRSDIFSFGAVLFEMLTGQRAFKRDSTNETMRAILNESVPPIDTKAFASSDPLFTIARKCLEKSADQRYQDVTELIDALNAVDFTPEMPRKNRLASAAA